MLRRKTLYFFLQISYTFTFVHNTVHLPFFSRLYNGLQNSYLSKHNGHNMPNMLNTDYYTRRQTVPTPLDYALKPSYYPERIQSPYEYHYDETISTNPQLNNLINSYFKTTRKPSIDSLNTEQTGIMVSSCKNISSSLESLERKFYLVSLKNVSNYY